MLPSMVTTSYNTPAAPVNTLAAYAQAGNMGVNILPPPQVLAPSVMAITPSFAPQAYYPQQANPTYIPWPYPMPSYYPMPQQAYPPPMMPPMQNPAAGPLPNADSKQPPQDAMNTPEVLSLSDIAHGLEDKTSLANQEMAADNLSKLIRENPDFQKLKTGAPEAVVMKALRSPDPQVRLKTMVALADDKVLSVTPKVKSLLKRAKTTGNTSPVEMGFVDVILNKNGRPMPIYSGAPNTSFAQSDSGSAQNNNSLPPLPPGLANNKELASLLKQGGNA